MTVNDAVATANPALLGLTVRVSNGSQYASREFRSSVAAPGIALKYTCVDTPEQSGHESFHTYVYSAPQDAQEHVWPREFADIREAREMMQAAFHDYSHSRIHSALEYLISSSLNGGSRMQRMLGHVVSR